MRLLLFRLNRSRVWSRDRAKTSREARREQQGALRVFDETRKGSSEPNLAEATNRGCQGLVGREEASSKLDRSGAHEIPNRWALNLPLS